MFGARILAISVAISRSLGGSFDSRRAVAALTSCASLPAIRRRGFSPSGSEPISQPLLYGRPAWGYQGRGRTAR